MRLALIFGVALLLYAQTDTSEKTARTILESNCAA
jgi:hypothetical protein